MESNMEQGAYKALTQEDVIDLRLYWQTVMRNKWGIIGFSMVITILAVLFVMSITPIYKATATLLIESQEANVVSIDEIYGLEGAASEYFETQFEILKSRQLAERVVDRLDLVNNPAFNKRKEPLLPFDLTQFLPEALNKPQLEPTMEQKRRSVVDSFMGNLSIVPIKRTQLVDISYESDDPELAVLIANTVGDAYIESNLEAKLELTLKATSWLSTRLESLRADLTEAERVLQDYRESEQIVGENGGINIASQEMELVANKLVDARRDRLEVESLYRQIQSIGKSNPERLELVPTVLQHPLVQRMKGELARVELKRSELAKRYGPKHPRMQSVNSEISNAREALNSQILSVVNGIETNYRVAQANERSLQRTLDGTKGNMQELNRKEYRLNELQQNVQAKQVLFETFLTRFNETSATGDLNTANARISDPAVIPKSPIKPKKKLIVLAVLIGSLMFGVLFALLLEILNNTVKNARDVENHLHETMLGLLPLLQKKRKEPYKSYRQFVEDPSSTYSESLRTIRTGVVLSALDNPHKTISVTSTIPGEGKTTLSTGLALAVGQMEKVLLLEADMRRPSIGRALGLNREAAGLSDVVAGSAKLEDAIQRFEAGNIDVLIAGKIPPNPSELLSSKRFGKLLEVLETKYDRIIIDTAPSQAVSDAMVLAQHVGAMIYVVKADSTTYQNARNGLKRLHEVKAPILGVVLNQVDVKRGAKYHGEEYGGYYDVYGYSSAKS
ncbi:MAG: GumC family protein [Neptunomonas phycophila]